MISQISFMFSLFWAHKVSVLPSPYLFGPIGSVLLLCSALSHALISLVFILLSQARPAGLGPAPADRPPPAAASPSPLPPGRSRTLREESQRRAATWLWRALRMMRGRRRWVPLLGLRLSRTALGASRRRMTESAFWDAIYWFNSFHRLYASSSSTSF